MPVNFVNINAAPKLAWGSVLELAADCIREHVNPAASGARVYPYWVYELDIATMLGRVTAPMIATSGTSEGKVHCWTLGIASAVYLRGASGAPEYVGGANSLWNWLITLDVWGLWSYDGTRTSQNVAIDEARLISAALFRNKEPMVAGTPSLVDVRPLEFTSLQPTPFSDGKLISVASGTMQVVVKEALGI